MRRSVQQLTATGQRAALRQSNLAAIVTPLAARSYSAARLVSPHASSNFKRSGYFLAAAGLGVGLGVALSDGPDQLKIKKVHKKRNLPQSSAFGQCAAQHHDRKSICMQ